MYDPIESTYKHKINVYRNTEIETEWGETLHERVVVYDHIKCAISFQGYNDRNKAPMVFSDMVTNKIEYFLKLYLNPKYNIMMGDEIEDIQTGIKYLAGVSMNFGSHQELAMLMRWQDI
jgi:hypothetical protein